MSCQTAGHFLCLDMKCFDHNIYFPYNHTRHIFDRFANLFLCLTDQRRYVVPIVQHDLTGNLQPAILIALPDMVYTNSSHLRYIVFFPDDPRNNGFYRRIINDKLPVIAENRTDNRLFPRRRRRVLDFLKKDWIGSMR